MVKQHEALRAGLPRNFDCILDRAVAPIGLRFEFCLRVLRIVNQEVNSVAQFQYTRINSAGVVQRLLMIAHICE